MKDSPLPAHARLRGFNLIEMSIVLAVVGVLSAITMPRAGRFLDTIRVRGAVIEIASLFSTARHIAIARGSRIGLDIDPARGTIVVVAGQDTLQRREITAAHDVELATNRTSITYSATGTGYGAANLTMIVSRGRFADTLIVSRLGRVRF
ncbi:MAG: GspH/FimT family pseudopilin [Gemmatimonadaceae bacterium]|nr:GspH/FimT family pseudopilin [Gemmatimonadaceae bacterium]MDQ3242111.1 GspH/FimT family pseudopilin [Gemmatimonadota bacterium]